MAEMKFSPEELRELVKEAIFSKMTPEGRDQLIRQALETLLKSSGIDNASRPNYGGSGYIPSPLQAAFNSAVSDIGREVVREVLETGEYREQIRRVAVDAVATMFARRADKVTEQVADRLGELLFPWQER